MMAPIVVPTWFLLSVVVCLGGTLLLQASTNEQLKGILSCVFGPTRANADRWEQLLDEGAFLSVNEDGQVLLLVPFGEQEALRQDARLHRIMGLLDRGGVHHEVLLEEFIDARIGMHGELPDETVGDFPPGGMAS